MTLTIPDSRFEMPQMFYPKRKPTGRVKIDWSHPLAAKLEYAAIDGLGTNLVNGDVGYDATFKTTHHAQYGAGRDFSTATKSHKFDISLGGVTEVCSFAIIKGNSNGGGYISVIRQDGTFTPVQLTDSNAVRLVHWGPLINAVPGSTINNSDAYSAISNRTSDGVSKLYLNGALDATTTGSTGVLATVSTPLVFGGTESDGELYKGAIYVSYIWKDRSLSSRERDSLLNNPYQFLIPA